MKTEMEQTEIGLIPDKWLESDLSALCIDNGLIRGPFGGALKKETFTPHGFKVYEQRNAIYKDVDLGKYYIDRTKFNELKRFAVRAGDYIISCSGTIGKHCCIPKRFEEGVINQALLIIRLNPKICDQRYFGHIFGSSKIQSKIIDDTQGGAMKNLVGMSEFRRTKVPLPTLSEQQAIAEALSDADAWIESLETLLQKKRHLKQGAMQQLLTPKDGWTQERLGSVISVYRGGSPRPIQNFISNDLNGINWIKIGDTNSSAKYILDSTEKIIPLGERYSRKVFVGDFLLSNSMSFGRPYILKIEGCIHDGWLVLQNYHAKFDTEFLYYLLSSDFIMDQYRSKAAGSSVLNLNKELVSSVVLPFPLKEEQIRIANILSEMDAEIETIEQKLNKARQIKQGMMQQLLTGQIRLVKPSSAATVETLQRATA